MWKLIIPVLFLLPSSAQETAVLNIEYQRVDKTVMDSQTEIRCHLKLTNHTADPFYNVRLNLQETVGVTIEQSFFEFGIILPKQTVKCSELLSISYLNGKEPPHLVWIAEVVGEDGLTRTIRLN